MGRSAPIWPAAAPMFAQLVPAGAGVAAAERARVVRARRARRSRGDGRGRSARKRRAHAPHRSQAARSCPRPSTWPAARQRPLGRTARRTAARTWRPSQHSRAPRGRRRPRRSRGPLRAGRRPWRWPPRRAQSCRRSQAGPSCSCLRDGRGARGIERRCEHRERACGGPTVAHRTQGRRALARALLRRALRAPQHLRRSPALPSTATIAHVCATPASTATMCSVDEPSATRVGTRTAASGVPPPTCPSVLRPKQLSAVAPAALACSTHE